MSARAREWGVVVGDLPTGEHNAITDVAGVRVGAVGICEGDGALVHGSGPVRTGVTAVWPAGGNIFDNKLASAAVVQNGFTKCAGLIQLFELQTLETPILITNTLNVGVCLDAMVDYLDAAAGWRFSSINCVVTECNDSFLSDIHGRHVGRDHVYRALDTAASGVVAEGNAGAGCGMSCYGLKGGIGTASRVVRDRTCEYRLGILVCTNMGTLADLRVDGVSVGRRISDVLRGEEHAQRAEAGSIVVLIATDAPLRGNALRRLARRSFHGVARTGSYTAAGSGEVAIAWSTTALRAAAGRSEASDGVALDPLFRAVVECSEEAVLNSLWAAETTTGRDGNRRRQIPLETVREILESAGRRFDGG